MPLTPQINLTITLDDLSGNQIGSSNIPAFVRVALCNYGTFLPRVAGTTMIARVGPYDIPYPGAPLALALWGNDVITPAGTYYTISILDAQKNVLQTAAYVFNGTISADLSTISPTFPAYSPTIIGDEVFIPFSATPQFTCNLLSDLILFNLVLTGNVTSSTCLAPQAGQIVVFQIQQDATGGRSFTWPTNVKNPGIINPAANSTTVQAFIADATGNLFPLGPQTWN